MKRLIILAFKCWGVLAAVCCTILATTPLRSAPELIHGLDTCEARLCFLNIIPGQTSWDEAQAQLRAMSEVNFDLNTYSATNLPGFHGRLVLIPVYDPDSDEQIIYQLNLSPSDHSTYIGNAILQLGIPCAVVRLSLENLGLVYPHVTIIASMTKRSTYSLLGPTSPVIHANVYSQATSCDRLGLERSAADFYWHGFRRYDDR